MSIYEENRPYRNWPDAKDISRRELLLGGGALLATSAIFAACGSSGGGRSAAGGGSAPKVPVRISTGRTVETANFFVAQSEGYYAKHGLDASLQAFTIPINGAQAMLAGTENVSELVQLPFLTFLEKGADIIIVANTCTSRNVYLVTKSDISKGSDLEGKKIGLPFGTGQQYAFAAYLQYVHLPANAVHLVNVQNENLVAAMSAGSIDGFLGIQPQVSQTLADVKGTHILEDPPATAAYVSPEYLVLERSWAESHRTAVEGLLGALIDAGSFIQSNKSQTAKIMASVMGLPAAQVETLMGPNPKGDDDNYSITLDVTTITASLRSVAAWMSSAGLMKTTPDISAAIDASFMKAVAPSAVSGAE